MAIQDDLITVVVPTYQGESYLKATLQSIQNQTHRNLEILVVDDGSRDGTLELVRMLQREDDRIRLYPLDHQGAPGHCRNFGLDHASAEYLICFDSDDIMYPSMLEEMLESIKKNGADLVIGNVRYLNMDTRQELSSNMEWFFAKEHHTLEELFQINPFPCNKLYRTSFLRKTKVRYLEGVFNQDLGYFLCNLFHEPSFAVISHPLMDYMVRQGSITTSAKTRKKHIDILTVFDQVFAEWDKTGNDPKFRYGLYHMFIRSMIFKAGFFDPLTEQNEISRIRETLYRYCPTWYREQAFRDFFSWKKRLYNRLLLQYRCDRWIGYYKHWKNKHRV